MIYQDSSDIEISIRRLSIMSHESCDLVRDENEPGIVIRGEDCAMYLTDKLKGAMFDPDYNLSLPTSYYERESCQSSMHSTVHLETNFGGGEFG